MGMQSEIHWLGDRNSWECSLRFIGLGIGQGLMGMQSEIHWLGNRNSWECSLRLSPLAGE